MRIAITGASGYLGRQLVPLLQARGATLVLVGRTAGREMNGLPIIGFDELTTAAANFDLLLHLSVLNNDQAGTEDDFARANADLAVETCLQARSAGIARFCLVSSSHALDEGNTSAYARSKRIAAERLRTIDGITVLTLFLPAVVGTPLSGRLKRLNGMPGPLRAVALKLAQAIQPTVNVQKIADWVLDDQSPRKAEILANLQAENLVFRAAKRAVDLALALGVILVLWWLMIIVWVAVRLQSAGPGLFAQDRVGQHARVFTCYKFRTMYVTTPDVGTHEVSASAVTPLGNLLRRTKLDELPQVINVLKNEMSFVGPRPCLPSQVELVQERRSWGIFDIKPGITGLAQVHKVDMSEPERITAWDYRYIRLQSLLLDLKIMLATATGKGSGDRIKDRGDTPA